jgi:glutaredoxin/uncharacterized protein (DUF302 family)
MNLSYYRKSKYSKAETLNRIRDIVSSLDLKIVNQIDLPKTGGTLVNICSDSWVDSVLKEDRNLVGLIPCNLFVVEQNGSVYVGSGNPSVLGSVSRNQKIQNLAVEAESKVRKLVNEVTDSGELKPSKIKLYSTTTCPYCVMEKQWLEAKNITHEVIYVDQDQKAAQEMVENTGQMGVPVTEIGFDDGDSEYIVGFDKRRLTEVLRI